MSWVHDLNSTVLMVLIGVHLSAITFYYIVKKKNLIRPMFTGRKTVSDGDESDPRFANPLFALAILAIASAVVWYIVGG